MTGSEGNFLAPLAVLAWIPITMILFASLRPAVACSIALIAPSILLPVGYGWNFEGLPALHRESIAVLAALVGMLTFARGTATRQPPIVGLEWLAVIMIAGGMVTAIGNRDVLWSGSQMLAPMSVWTGIGGAFGIFFQYWAPLYLGRALFHRPRELRWLLSVLAVMGLLYAIPVLWEARMSPQLHRMLYGYMPANWLMSIRNTGWGWRPMVFVGHGLALSLFMVSCALAATALWRARVRIAGFSLAPLPPFLGAIVVACQSLASLVYAAGSMPLLAFASASLQRKVILGLAVMVLSYPALRTAGLFPTDQLVALSSYDGGRAGSLKMRFDMEDLLLEKARTRLWFGWGGFGRERRYDLHELDLEMTKSATISDGYWIIIFGQRGVVGFVCAFGMLLLPVVGASVAAGRRRTSSDSYLMLGTAWICVVGAIDLLPNGFLTPRHVFIAGALYGAARGWARSDARSTVPSAGPPMEPAVEAPAPMPEASLSGGLLKRTPPTERSRG